MQIVLPKSVCNAGLLGSQPIVVRNANIVDILRRTENNRQQWFKFHCSCTVLHSPLHNFSQPLNFQSQPSIEKDIKYFVLTLKNVSLRASISSSSPSDPDSSIPSKQNCESLAQYNSLLYY